MKEISEMTGPELADALQNANDTGNIEAAEILQKEVERRATEMLNRAELRHPDNPDWETRPIPPINVEICDSWRTYVAEGAGTQRAVDLEGTPISTDVPGLLTIAEQIHKVCEVLYKINDKLGDKK